VPPPHTHTLEWYSWALLVVSSGPWFVPPQANFNKSAVNIFPWGFAWLLQIRHRRPRDADFNLIWVKRSSGWLSGRERSRSRKVCWVCSEICKRGSISEDYDHHGSNCWLSCGVSCVASCCFRRALFVLTLLTLVIQVLWVYIRLFGGYFGHLKWHLIAEIVDMRADSTQMVFFMFGITVVLFSIAKCICVCVFYYYEQSGYDLSVYIRQCLLGIWNTHYIAFRQLTLMVNIC